MKKKIEEWELYYRMYYKNQNLYPHEQYCIECFDRVSYTQPCPKCKNLAGAKEVKKLPNLNKMKKSYAKKSPMPDEIYDEMFQETKFCIRCKKSKKIEEYGKSLYHLSGIKNICKECDKKYQEKYQKAYKERNDKGE